MTAPKLAAHTPGPWRIADVRVIERPVRVNEHFAVRPLAGPTFAFLPAGSESRRDTQEANARLIAAAPELLAFVASILDKGLLDGIAAEDARVLVAKAEGVRHGNA